jgi:N-acetylneuraminate synthase/sialic acid synthase
MITQGERTLEIGPDLISDSGPCYVIAEIGHNHQGSVEKCKEHFDRAKECGASAAKLQKRDNRALFTDEYFHRPYENENSFGATYGEHREALEFGRDEYLELKSHAEEIGITFFATAFDAPSVDFLAELDMPAYKVASADVTNTPLLSYIAEVGKPIILSTGGATLEDVVRAYETLASVNPEVAILQCTCGYPADWEELDLRVIETYQELFPEAVVGFSSHDNGIAMAVAAYVIGGRIVEKHFTLDRAMRGTDHRFSLEPQGLGKMVRDLERVQVALGDGTKTVYESEAAPATKMGKKLVAARDLPAGHVLEAGDLAAKSPGDGVAPYELPKLVGSSLRRSIVKDQDLGFELLEPRPDGDAVAFRSVGNAA